MNKLGLDEWSASLYIEMVKEKEGYISEIIKLTRIPRSKSYGVVQNLIDIGAIQVTSKLPFGCRAISPIDVYFEKLEKMSNDLNMVTDGIEDLQEGRYGDEKTTTYALTMMGLSSKESIVYKSLLQHGEGPFAKVIHYSGLPRESVISVLLDSKLRDLGLIEDSNSNSTSNSTRRKIYRAIFPSFLFFEELERMTDRLNTSLNAVAALQSMYKTPKTTALLTINQHTNRWKVARIVLNEKGGITKENIESLKVSDFKRMGYRTRFDSLEKFKEKMLKKFDSGDFS